MPIGFGGRRGSGGLKLRLMIALGIALFSFVSYYMNGQKNPVTGETQRVSMSPDEEIALGLSAAPKMAGQHGGLHPDTQHQQIVDRVGAQLLQGLDGYLQAKGGSNPYKFEFHLLADPRTINAFALPGGQVFITAALYSKLKSRGQLAGVLGHEIGHVLSRHGAQRLAKQKLTSGLVGAAGVAGGGNGGASLARAIGQMLNMKYGRGDELESDRWGVLLTAQAGYDPRAMLGVMDILDEASGGQGPPEMMSTHPKPANRKQYIQDVMRSVFPDGIPNGLEQ